MRTKLLGLLSDPGRAICAHYAFLVTQVLGAEHVSLTGVLRRGGPDAKAVPRLGEGHRPYQRGSTGPSPNDGFQDHGPTPAVQKHETVPVNNSICLLCLNLRRARRACVRDGLAPDHQVRPTKMAATMRLWSGFPAKRVASHIVRSARSPRGRLIAPGGRRSCATVTRASPWCFPEIDVEVRVAGLVSVLQWAARRRPARSGSTSIEPSSRASGNRRGGASQSHRRGGNRQ
jgi:hypothetical protein